MAVPHESTPLPTVRALAVVSPAVSGEVSKSLRKLGFEPAIFHDPYSAASELLRRPLVFRLVVVSLASVYREELALIDMIRRRLPHVDVGLIHVEGRSAMLAESIRLGATVLLDADKLERLSPAAEPPSADHSPSLAAVFAAATAGRNDAEPDVEPLLSADELRALLADVDASTDFK